MIYYLRGDDCMTVQSITLMEAYIIEHLRKNGVSNEEIIQINDESVERWKQLDDRFDYTILQRLAEDTGDKFSAIINDGYNVKFLTINGLINLIELKCQQKRNEDFYVHEDGISHLHVSKDEQEMIEQILSPNWVLTETKEGLSIRSSF